jgi:hypothetical protein
VSEGEQWEDEATTSSAFSDVGRRAKAASGAFGDVGRRTKAASSASGDVGGQAKAASSAKMTRGRAVRGWHEDEQYVRRRWPASEGRMRSLSFDRN